MSPRSPGHLLGHVGLAALAVVTLGLSVAALSLNRVNEQAPAPHAPAGSHGPIPIPKEESIALNRQPSGIDESTLDDSPATPGGKTVVILGDEYSTAEAPTIWVQAAGNRLGWGTVINMSEKGRGYAKKPQTCGIPVCSSFKGSVAAAAELHPDVVVTFGGTADGDNDLSDAAEAYFAALREALPEAQLIAISPVTLEDEPPFWLTMHNRTIRAGVEAVGGTFIDVGQPGSGDGDHLSAAAQNDMANVIIEELS